MTIGSLIRSKREKLEMTREQLAKKLKITPGYMGHIERGAPVRVSERLQHGLSHHLHIWFNQIKPLAEKQNKISSKWYREYRAKRA